MLIQILTLSMLQYNRIEYAARSYIYSKLILVAPAEDYKKQQ